MVAWYASITILTKWQALVDGKYFWLRNIVSSLVAVAIYSVVMSANTYFTGVTTPYGRHNTYILAVSALAVKVIYILGLALPSSLIVSLLKKMESKNSEFGIKLTRYSNPIISLLKDGIKRQEL